MNRIDVAVPPMASVWWPWACQLLAAHTRTGTVDLDLLALEPRRIRGTTVAAGTVFSIRATAATKLPTSDLGVVAGWSATGATVTVLAGRHRRSSWACLSAGHRRVVLTDVQSSLGVVAPPEPTVTAASPRHLEPTETTPLVNQE